jgi:hypothetical protein
MAGDTCLIAFSSAHLSKLQIIGLKLACRRDQSLPQGKKTAKPVQRDPPMAGKKARATRFANART